MVLLVHQLLLAELEHRHTAFIGTLCKPDYILVLRAVEHHVLLVHAVAYSPALVAQTRRALKVQRLGGLLHHRGQTVEGGLLPVRDEAYRLADYLRVVLLGYAPRAQTHAPLDVEVEARAALADFLREAPSACRQPERGVHILHGLPQQKRRRIRPQPPRPRLVGIFLHLKRNTREVPRANANIVPALVVLEQNIILGFMLAYHARLKHQSLELARGHNGVEVISQTDHAPSFVIVLVHRAKIARDTHPKLLRLADIDYLARVIAHDINPRLIRELCRLLAQLWQPRVIQKITPALPLLFDVNNSFR
jgi:hypothetical protein